tara:strand:+ start:54 stop:641 length:588 start_codon:yes stop_codon:yes gene_type:complete
MNKIKPDIIKNKLSWEKKNANKKCDYEKCNELGRHKAPRSRSNLNSYYFFCLKHVREYNKSWDFYKGLSVEEIELSLRKDIVWDRPSWPLNGNPNKVLEQIKSFLNNDYSLFENDRDYQNFLKNKIIMEDLTLEEQESLKILDLKMPINVEKIKKVYKKLVKIFHPDVNKENKDAEKIFKEINKAYRILLKKFLK